MNLQQRQGFQQRKGRLDKSWKITGLFASLGSKSFQFGIVMFLLTFVEMPWEEAEHSKTSSGCQIWYVHCLFVILRGELLV